MKSDFCKSWGCNRKCVGRYRYSCLNCNGEGALRSSFCEKLGCTRECIGGCRYLCLQCSNVRFLIIYPSGQLNCYHSAKAFREAYGLKNSKKKYLLAKETLSVHSGEVKCELVFEPMCDSCKIVERCRRMRWGRYWRRCWEGVLSGNPEAEVSLRMGFWDRGETIEKLLAFFSCIPLSMNDAFVRLIDYSYYW